MKDPVVQEGAAVLREKAKPVLKKDIGNEAITSVINTMKKALAGENFGVAIAAPQIGESLRIFVIAGRAFLTDEDKKAFDEEPKQKLHEESLAESSRRPEDFSKEVSVKAPTDRVFINPTLTRLSRKKKEMSEGCLSVRGMYGTVMRHEKATVQALDEKKANHSPITAQDSSRTSSSTNTTTSMAYYI